jgi:hypothetical protein
MTEEGLVFGEAPRPPADEREPRREADTDTERWPDPAPREGEAEEEDRAEDQREPAEPGQATATQELVEITE